MKPLFTSIALIPNNPTKLATIEFLNFEWFQLKKNEIRWEDVKVKTREDSQIGFVKLIGRVCGSSIKHGYYH